MDRFALLLLVVSITCLTACSSNTKNTGDLVGPTRDTAQIIAEINAAPTPDGVADQVFQQLKAALIRSIEERNTSGKTFSAGPPTSPNVYSTVAMDTGNNLLWYMENPGDYNQDGEVGINDLTPLGIYFNQTGPFMPESQQYVVDGNGDGEINISDVTTIGQNFGNKITNYVVYASDDEADYPLSEMAKETPTPTELANIPVNSVNPDVGQRKLFSFDADSTGLKKLWVAPSDGTTEGTPSTLTSGRWHVSGDIMPDGFNGYRASLCHLTNGNLGVAMMDAGTNALLFMESTDPQGNNWETPITITTDVNPDASPEIFDREVALSIGYTFESDMYLAYSLDAAHETWGSIKMEPQAATSSVSSIDRAASANGKREIVKVTDMDGVVHGFYENNGVLYHLGHRGAGAIRTSDQFGIFSVDFTKHRNEVSIAIYNGHGIDVGVWTLESGWSWQSTAPTMDPGADISHWAQTSPVIDNSTSNTVIGFTTDTTVDIAMKPSDSPESVPYEQFTVAEMDGVRPQLEITQGDTAKKPADQSLDPRASPIFWLVNEQAFHVLCRIVNRTDETQSAEQRIFIGLMAASQQFDVFEQTIDTEEFVSSGVKSQFIVHSTKDDQNNCGLQLFRHDD